MIPWRTCTLQGFAALIQLLLSGLQLRSASFKYPLGMFKDCYPLPGMRTYSFALLRLCVLHWNALLLAGPRGASMRCFQQGLLDGFRTTEAYRSKRRKLAKNSGALTAR